MHLPSPELIQAWPQFTSDKPLRILVSGCLVGQACGVDGSSYGEFQIVKKILALPNVQSFHFCPEDWAFGTPRAMPDIHGGDGFAVLDGKARVINDQGEDWTEGMIQAAHAMLLTAQDKAVNFALLMDMSAACGSQVISDGCRLRPDRKYQKGPGVAAALLLRHGFLVMSQRDYRTLECILHKLDSSHSIDQTAKDHHNTVWYLGYFKS